MQILAIKKKSIVAPPPPPPKPPKPKLDYALESSWKVKTFEQSDDYLKLIKKSKDGLFRYTLILIVRDNGWRKITENLEHIPDNQLIDCRKKCPKNSHFDDQRIKALIKECFDK